MSDPTVRGGPSHRKVGVVKASFFRSHGGPDVLEFGDLPEPVPGPGEVRVRVEASALNHLDLWVRRGLPEEIPLPHVGGADVAGVVEALGPDVEGVDVGVRVVVDPAIHYGWYRDPEGSPQFRMLGEHRWGGFAEYVVLPASNLLVLPETVSAVQAAAAGLVFVTAWHALVGRGRLEAGERVLITGGSGGVSTAAIQLARHLGARVYAVTSGPRNVARLEALGAHVVFDRLAGSWGKTLWHETEKRGVHLVLDSVGEAVWSDSLRALAPYGRLVTYGATSGATGPTLIPLVFWRQLSVLGSTMGTPEEFREVMALVFKGEVRPIVQEVLPLSAARSAHEQLEAKQVFGKLVLVP